MWIFAPVIAVATAFVIWGFWPRKRFMTEADVVSLLEKWVSESLAFGEWDYFESCELQNPRLEDVRKRCAELSLDPELTIDPHSWRLNAAGEEVVRLLILEIRGHSSAAA